MVGIAVIVDEEIVVQSKQFTQSYPTSKLQGSDSHPSV